MTITSVGASNFGATDPFFTWLDMERELVDRGLLSTPSLAASIGGANDSGRGLSPKGRQLLRDAIDRSGARRIDAANLEDSIRERLGLYREGCGPGPVAAYVNIGGGVASLGHSLNAGLVPTGATLRLPRRNYPQRGALIRLAAEGVPVIHLLNVRQLRDRHGLEPVRDAVPQPGTGAIFGEVRYDLPRAVIATAVILGLLTALFAFDRQTHQLGRRGPEDATP
ncbi:MAG: poly-gamma-glutamate system protein [Acidobacteriota bacterium]